MGNFIFNKSLIIGVGLIGSSLARGLKNKKLSKLVFGYDINKNVRNKCIDLKLVDCMLDTLDLIEDLELMQKIVSKIQIRPILMNDIINLLNENPELTKINSKHMVNNA